MFSPSQFTAQKRSLPPQPKAPSFPSDADWALHYDIVLNDPKRDYSSKVNAALVVWNSLARMDRKTLRKKCNDIARWIQWNTLELIIGGPWEIVDVRTKEFYQSMLQHCINIDKKGIITSIAERIIKILHDPWQKSYWDDIKAIECGEKMKDPPAERLNIGMELIIRLQTLCKRDDKSAALKLAMPLVRIICSGRQCIEGILNEEEINFVEDVFFTLIHKMKTISEMVLSLRKFSLPYGVKLIHRYVKDPPYRVWNTKWDLAVVIADYFLAFALMQPIKETASILRDLIKDWVMLHKTTEFEINMLTDLIRKFLKGVESACQIYTMCEVLFHEHGEIARPLCIELYIRALTTDLNVLEQHKLKPSPETCEEIQCRLSKGFLMLGELMKKNIGAHRECLLSAFSLNPNKDMYKQIENIAHICKVYLENNDRQVQVIENESDSLNSFKTGCFRGVIVEDADQLGLSKQFRDDLIVLLNSSRYRDLSWTLSWEDLRKVCMNYVKFGRSVRPAKEDLKYLNIDYHNQRPFEDIVLMVDNLGSNSKKNETHKAKSNSKSATQHDASVKLTESKFKKDSVDLNSALEQKNNQIILKSKATKTTVNSQINWKEFNLEEWGPFWNSNFCNPFESNYNLPYPFGNSFDSKLWNEPFNTHAFDAVQISTNGRPRSDEYYLQETTNHFGGDTGLQRKCVGKVNKKNRVSKSSVNRNILNKNNIWFQDTINCASNEQKIVLKRAPSCRRRNNIPKANEGGNLSVINYVAPSEDKSQGENCTRRSERVFLRT